MNSIQNDKHSYQYLVYNKDGKFENVYNTVHEITQDMPGYKDSGIYSAVKNLNRYKDKYFRQIRTGESFPKSIEVNILCWIDGRPFYKQKEITEYTSVTKQAVSACCKRRGKKIGGKEIIWNDNTE